MNKRPKISLAISKKFIYLLLLNLLLVNLNGCGAVAGITQELTSRTIDWVLEPSSTVMKIKFEASEHLNPDIEGRASPLVARLYELKSADVFNNAEFFALYDDDKNILGDDIQYREDIELKPGEKRALTLETQPETRFIAVFAAFRDMEAAQWRTSVALPLNETTPVSIRFDEVTVTISFPKED